MATQNIYALTDTWNAGGTTFTAIKMDVLDTASAAGSLLLDLQVGGASQFSVNKAGQITAIAAANTYMFQTDTATWAWSTPGFSGVPQAAIKAGSFQVANIGSFSFSASNSANGTQDVILNRDAADTLAQRRGTNAQAFRVYNTFTDASNYERAKIAWSTNVLQIGTEKLGTGTARALDLQTDGTSRWSIGATTGHFIAAADNTYDIGASGANRPRNIYVGNTTFSNAIEAASNYRWTNGTNIVSPSSGVIGIYNNGSTDFSRLQFGGTTSAFPALKRDGAGVSIRLADDSAATFIKHNPVTVASLPAAATAGAGARMFVSDANAPTFGSAVAGGGAVTVPVYSTGSAWNVG